MYEQWTFNYEDRIFPTPVITLPFVDQAIEELEWVVERGAKVILIRPAPVPGLEGSRSFALPEFDPFWKKVEEADIAVRHARLRRRHRASTSTCGRVDTGGEFLPFANCDRRSRRSFRHQRRGIFDAMASAVGHGMLSRVPRAAPPAGRERLDLGSPAHRGVREGVRAQPEPLRRGPRRGVQAQRLGAPLPRRGPAGPSSADRRRPRRVRLRLPAPRGPRRPGRATPKQLDGLSHDDIAQVMGGNLAEALKIAA